MVVLKGRVVKRSKTGGGGWAELAKARVAALICAASYEGALLASHHIVHTRHTSKRADSFPLFKVVCVILAHLR